jgi:hypothetical protein
VDLTSVWAELVESRAVLADLSAPAAPGVYAFFVDPVDALPVDGVGEKGLCYIGRSGNLAQREFDSHFKAGASGFSTFGVRSEPSSSTT